MYRSTTYQSPIGNITLACDKEGQALVGLWLDGQKYYGGRISESMAASNEVLLLHTAEKWLDRYFSGKKPDPKELPLSPIGSPFQQCVWDILSDIPYGELTTYGEIAKKIADQRGERTMSAQAVGGAVAHNPISILIPCHRVIGSGGSLTGYAGGIDRKIWLLESEGIDTSKLTRPHAVRS